MGASGYHWTDCFVAFKEWEIKLTVIVMLRKLLSLLLFDAIDLLLNVYITTRVEGEHLLFSE